MPILILCIALFSAVLLTKNTEIMLKGIMSITGGYNRFSTIFYTIQKYCPFIRIIVM